MIIIKSKLRAGHKHLAKYLKDQGENEKIRLVEISDPLAANLDEAFAHMWTIASASKARVPLHHVSINPEKDERLTQEQMFKVIARCEQKYGYRPGEHQRVVVEHIKDGRMHYHVVWNRVSLRTGKAVKLGQHWNKSKQVAREMEKELGLRPPGYRRLRRARSLSKRTGRTQKIAGRYKELTIIRRTRGSRPVRPAFGISNLHPKHLFRPVMWFLTRRGRKKDEENNPNAERRFIRPQWESEELLAWAWANGRADILAQFGINLPSDFKF